MSIQTCEQFFAKTNTDSALQQEVNTALEGKESDEAATAFVWVGAKHGYEFTAEEVQTYMDAKGGELDQDALEQVAGGQSWTGSYGNQSGPGVWGGSQSGSSPMYSGGSSPSFYGGSGPV